MKVSSYNSILATIFSMLALFGTPTLANAEALQFSAAYQSTWSQPTPKIKLNENSVTTIESESQFKKLFGESSNLGLNWRQSFLALIYTNTRSNGGYGLSIDAVNYIANESRRTSKIHRRQSSDAVSIDATETTQGEFCFTPSVVTPSLALIKVTRNKRLSLNRSKKISAVLGSYHLNQDRACSLAL